jgi:hypothetical protein
MRHVMVRRTALVLGILLVAGATLFVWLVQPESAAALDASALLPGQTEARPDAPAAAIPSSNAAEPQTAPAAPVDMPAPSNAAPSQEAARSLDPTPSRVRPEGPTAAPEATRPSPAPPDGAALFASYCGRCHTPDRLRLDRNRTGLEAFLRTHGDSSDADDRVILDYLAGRSAGGRARPTGGNAE